MNKIGMESLKDATLNLYYYPPAEKIFPIHPQGSVTIVFVRKRYQVQPNIGDYSHVLSKMI